MPAAAWADDVLWAGRLTRHNGPQALLEVGKEEEKGEMPKELDFLRAKAVEVLAADAVNAEWKKSRIRIFQNRSFRWEAPFSFRWEVEPLRREEAAYIVRARLFVQGDLRLEGLWGLSREQPLLVLYDEELFFLFVR